jgi:transketolase
MADGRPSLISCRTVIGKGAPTSRAATMSTVRRWARTRSPRPANIWAGARLPSDPAQIMADWRATGDAGRDLHAEWDARLAAAPQGAEFMRRMAGELPSGEEAGKAFAQWLEKSRTSPRARLRSWRSKS